MSGATFSKLYTHSPGDTILSAEVNAEWDNLYDNLDMAGVGTTSDTVLAFQTTTDPGEVGSESLPTSLEGEIQRIRQLIKEITGKTQWYESPDSTLSAVFDSDPNKINNLRLVRSSTQYTITSADATALSGTNYGTISINSATSGASNENNIVNIDITADTTFNFHDDASPHIPNYGFGIDTTIDWDEKMPFFIGVVNKDDTDVDGTDGNSALFITRCPNMHETPLLAADIGDTGTAAPSNDADDTIVLLGTYTVADYTELPCRIIGCMLLEYNSTTPGWDCPTTNNPGACGIGEIYLDNISSIFFTLPAGQNDGGTDSYIQDNGGTAPVFTTQTYEYRIHRNGDCTVRVFLNGDGGTDGAGSVQTRLVLPYTKDAHGIIGSEVAYLPRIVATGSGITTGLHMLRVDDGESYADIRQLDASTVLNSQFGAGARSITGTFTYNVYGHGDLGLF